MPVLHICYDESLEPAIRASGELVAELSAALCDKLDAVAEKCQVVLTRGLSVSPLPIYVELKFRANTGRDDQRVADAMQSVADILTSRLATGVRIRGFAIDQARLHALDVPTG